MIAPEHVNDALQAIQALIVQARHAAFEARAKDVGNLLDDIEALPALLSDDLDQAREFEQALEGIAQKHPECRFVLEQYLGRTANT
jgi:hypothetical protein